MSSKQPPPHSPSSSSEDEAKPSHAGTGSVLAPIARVPSAESALARSWTEGMGRMSADSSAGASVTSDSPLRPQRVLSPGAAAGELERLMGRKKNTESQGGSASMLSSHVMISEFYDSLDTESRRRLRTSRAGSVAASRGTSPDRSSPAFLSDEPQLEVNPPVDSDVKKNQVSQLGTSGSTSSFATEASSASLGATSAHGASGTGGRRHGGVVSGSGGDGDVVDLEDDYDDGGGDDDDDDDEEEDEYGGYPSEVFDARMFAATDALQHTPRRGPAAESRYTAHTAARGSNSPPHPELFHPSQLSSSAPAASSMPPLFASNPSMPPPPAPSSGPSSVHSSSVLSGVQPPVGAVPSSPVPSSSVGSRPMPHVPAFPNLPPHGSVSPMSAASATRGSYGSRGRSPGSPSHSSGPGTGGSTRSKLGPAKRPVTFTQPSSDNPDEHAQSSWQTQVMEVLARDGRRGSTMNKTDIKFSRISVSSPEQPLYKDPEHTDICILLHYAMGLRDKIWTPPAVSRQETDPDYHAPADSDELFKRVTEDPPPAPMPSDLVLTMKEGVFGVYRVSTDPETTSETPELEITPRPLTLKRWYKALNRLMRIVNSGPVKTYCYRRLKFLEMKFNLHCLLNNQEELITQKQVPHRDFYNVHKVDTHIHHSSAMTQKGLLRFIKRKLRQSPDEPVIQRQGETLTLAQVFESLNLTGHDLNLDMMDMHADNTVFHRFDKFNLKYNPAGQARLREIFMKTDNFMNGAYLAEITQDLIQELEENKYVKVEWRVSIYGRRPDEWDKLARWVISNKLVSTNVRWMIQLPRLYAIHKAGGHVNTFADLLSNVFQPLFEVTMDPSSHPELHQFLKLVVGFDSVDDESKPEVRPLRRFPPPQNWDLEFNPPYSYYMYYMYANLLTLNKLREMQGEAGIAFRPHSGEAGEIDHLGATFLAADGISHGINLRKAPVLQYLYYLRQVPMAMSPLSNNSLFIDYHKNPFRAFHATGLNVSLSTDDPLQVHVTKEALIEEYSVASQVWKLTSTDQCEVARNSVLMSGFEPSVKRKWHGVTAHMQGFMGNDIYRTNVPDIRIKYREETLRAEWEAIVDGVRSYRANNPEYPMGKLPDTRVAK